MPQDSTQNQSLETLEGIVERLTFHSQESGHTIARFKVPHHFNLVTIVGSFANIQAGQTLRVSGFWRDHPKYGEQFQVKSYQETKPATLTGLEKYLGSGLIKGVGPVTAKRIVKHFGLETLKIIEEEIERLYEVPGIAQKRIQMIQGAWHAQKAIKEVMMFLQSHGVSTTYAVKIYKTYGETSISTVEKNPYQLTKDVYGIGFITADAIARNIGIGPGSEFRYRAGTIHVLNEASEEGHCYLPKPELMTRVVKRLTLEDHVPDLGQVESILIRMEQEAELMPHRVVEESETVELCYSPVFFHAEQKLADRLKVLMMKRVETDGDRVENWIHRFMVQSGCTLSPEQQAAVKASTEHRVLILTGGPGTGKTTTTRAIAALWKAMGKEIALGSPTGRAAQRLSEVTRMDASTIHRLLEFDPKSMQFQRQEENPIEADAVIIDEASMLDLFLGNSLLKAIALDAQLLLVGDIDQLPSVGPGNVLRDLIGSGTIPVVRLTEVFRQAQASQIVMNAHRINEGQYPKLESVSPEPTSDCLWLGPNQPADGVQAIQDLVSDLLPSLGINVHHDVQVLCPMTRGEIGTRNLNTVLQGLINPAFPGKGELVRGNRVLRVGDRVIQKVNDYNREVFNGDLGLIAEVDSEDQAVTVSYGARQVSYDLADLNEIALAWAITIHKSQGSEYPVVILPMFMSHYLMLSRNLLYTGLTRAKKLAIVVGPQKAIGLAVRQIKVRERYTLLAQRLAY